MRVDEQRVEIRDDNASASLEPQGDRIVLREPNPWRRSVVALLKHLEAVGFEGAPRAVGNGFAADGREAVTYIEGSSPHPKAWDDAALVALGSLLRELHEATAPSCFLRTLAGSRGSLAIFAADTR